ncbi:hypothetical protein LINPERPRIM_LOCUS928, partial [Linum perenne]
GRSEARSALQVQARDFGRGDRQTLQGLRQSRQSDRTYEGFPLGNKCEHREYAPGIHSRLRLHLREHSRDRRVYTCLILFTLSSPMCSWLPSLLVVKPRQM